MEVIDALTAEILDLEVISDRFDPSNLGFMDHMWGFFTGNQLIYSDLFGLNPLNTQFHYVTCRCA